MKLDSQLCYQAIQRRDPRSDGRFFTAVHTTGIYCRPICPAPTPKAANVSFYPCAAAAEAAGFRACRRCRPESAPGTPAWVGTSATVTRALRLLDKGVEQSAAGLARRLGVSPRHLRRLFARHLGTSPRELLTTHRAQLARRLVEETDWPLTEIAWAAGFGSIRQFNQTMRARHGIAPRQLRQLSRRRTRPALDPVQERDLELRLGYRPPLDWTGLLEYLAARATPGVERVRDGAYERVIRGPGGWATVKVRHDPLKHALLVQLSEGVGGELTGLVARVRRLFDLDADPGAITGDLARDPQLAPLVAAFPGVRVPGAWDVFEITIRAVLGQQISVPAATTLAGRLVHACGPPLNGSDGLSHGFPSARAVAEADLQNLGLTRSRQATLKAVAAADQKRPLAQLEGLDLATLDRELQTIKGVGPWTAQYVAMRGFGEPDAWPAADLGLLRASRCPGPRGPDEVLKKLTSCEQAGSISTGSGARSGNQQSEFQLSGGADASALAVQAQAWRPWRAYAAMLLWRSLGTRKRNEAKERSA